MRAGKHDFVMAVYIYIIPREAIDCKWFIDQFSGIVGRQRGMVGRLAVALH